MFKKSFIQVVALLFLLTGCLQQEEQLEQKTLKVLAWNAAFFNDKYGNFFLATHPNYDLEVISFLEHRQPNEHFAATIERIIMTENPDVVTLAMEEYTSFVEQNQLVSLTSFINKDEFDTSDFMPAILDFLADESNQIYGLPPTFVGSALYYNKTIFTENGVPFPADSMMWDDVFQLAQRIPIYSNTNEPQFGYYDRNSGNPFLMALYIGGGSGLSFYNNDGFTFSTPAWENIFTSVLQCVQSEACYDPALQEHSAATDVESSEKNIYPFLVGNIAMAINDSSLYGTLMNSERYSELEWDIVPLPSDPERRGVGSGVQMQEIFSIPISSGQAEDAWKFIKYVNSPEYARLMPNINPNELPTRLPTGGQYNESFYQLEQLSNITQSTFKTLPAEVITEMDRVADQYMDEILNDETTVPEALEKIESELQAKLDIVVAED